MRYYFRCLVEGEELLPFHELMSYAYSVAYLKRGDKLVYIVYSIEESDVEEFTKRLQIVYNVESLGLLVKVAPKITSLV